MFYGRSIKHEKKSEANVFPNWQPLLLLKDIIHLILYKRSLLIFEEGLKKNLIESFIY